jgi:translocator protein
MPATPSAAAPMPARPHGVLVLVGLVVLCQVAGSLGALTTSATWYRELVRPSWAPPGWLFGPVWLTLYTMMGVAAWLVWRGPSASPRTRALVWFGVQLALNAAWTPTFFGLRSLGGGLIVIVTLIAAIVITIAQFRRLSSPAAWLLAPYLAWVGFATALNASLWWLNR